MEGLIMAAQLILSLTILVAVHEWGHYITARMFKIRVERFYIFFDFLFPFPSVMNFSLFKKKVGHTEWGLGWFPMGGYVKIAGMMDESMDKEQLKKEPEDWEFRAKPAWQRLIVMLGGIIVNVIVGVILFIIIHMSVGYTPIDEINKDGIYAHRYGQEVGFRHGDQLIAIDGAPLERWKDANSPVTFFGSTFTVKRNGSEVEVITPDTTAKAIKMGDKLFAPLSFNYDFQVDSIYDSIPISESEMIQSPARIAGLEVGDKITSINNETVGGFLDVGSLLRQYRDQEVTVGIERNGTPMQLGPVHIDSSVAVLGFQASEPDESILNLPKESYSFGEAFSWGIYDAFNVIRVNAIGLGQIFSGKAKATESLSGPIGIAQAFGAEWDWLRFWTLTAFLSMVLAFMNLLPIPALDGGHVVVTIIEWIRGKALPDKVQQVIQMVGLVIVFLLMILVFGVDIGKLFS